MLSIFLCLPLFSLHSPFLGLRGDKRREIVMLVKWDTPVSRLSYLLFSDALPLPQALFLQMPRGRAEPNNNY